MSENSTNNLTIIYASAQKTPVKFRENIQRELGKSAKDYPIYLSIDPPEKASITNYLNTLAEVCYDIDTPYVAIAEDDTLYPDEHFNHRPPDLETFSYNMTRWNIYTWSKEPFFALRQRKILATLIAPRIAFIDVLEKRLKTNDESKMVEPGRRKDEKFETFETYNPIVVFNHPFGFGSMDGKKRSGMIRALAIPYWGEAKELIKLYETNS